MKVEYETSLEVIDSSIQRTNKVIGLLLIAEDDLDRQFLEQCWSNDVHVTSMASGDSKPFKRLGIAPGGRSKRKTTRRLGTIDSITRA